MTLVQHRASLAAAAMLVFSAHSYAQDWSFQLEPYILASSIEGDTSIGRVTGVEVDVDFSDILEVLDIGLMGRFEAQHSSGWGVILDYGFMDLSDDITGQRGGVLEARLRQGVFEALLTRRRELQNGHIDYLAGVRWWDNDIDVTIVPAILPGSATSNIEEDWVDLIVGVRWANPLNDRWTFHLRGDVGGFGVEADFTGSIAAGFHYQMTSRLDLDLQYKALWVDYETGSRGQPGFFSYDTVTHGPFAGLIFNF